MEKVSVVYEFHERGWRGRSTRSGEILGRGRTLATCRSEVQKSLADAQGCREEDLALEERFDLPDGLGEVLESVRQTRSAAEMHRRRSVEATHEAVARLASVEPALGMRDIGQMVGVSYQRVQQLLSTGQLLGVRNGSNGRP